MISIVTGTLNRLQFLPDLIDNTVNSNPLLELVLVDGGSTDGTIEYIKALNHPQIKFIEVGGRSSYPHFMNLGIQNATHDLICQWNDDVILINTWDDIIAKIEDNVDFYLFNWKYGYKEDTTSETWLNGFDQKDGWCLAAKPEIDNEMVMNYGIYRKKIFKEIGLYNLDYRYYYADGDMTWKAYKFGYNFKACHDIKVCSLHTDKVATYYNSDFDTYQKNRNLYNNKQLPENTQYLI